MQIPRPMLKCVLVTLLSVVSADQQQANSQPSVNDYLSSAKELMASGKYYEALDKYQEAISKKKRNGNDNLLLNGFYWNGKI